jgi:hypothetical protein
MRPGPVSAEVARALGLDAAPVEIDPLVLWPAERQCFVGGARLELSRREFELLLRAAAPGWTFIHTHRQVGVDVGDHRHGTGPAECRCGHARSCRSGHSR